jgi:hypothetical protein
MKTPSRCRVLRGVLDQAAHVVFLGPIRIGQGLWPHIINADQAAEATANEAAHLKLYIAVRSQGGVGLF